MIEFILKQIGLLIGGLVWMFILIVLPALIWWGISTMLGYSLSFGESAAYWGGTMCFVGLCALFICVNG